MYFIYILRYTIIPIFEDSKTVFFFKYNISTLSNILIGNLQPEFIILALQYILGLIWINRGLYKLHWAKFG